MLAVERRKQILEQVHKDKKVIVSELSKQFRVSEETIRRDLEKLADEVVFINGGKIVLAGNKDDILEKHGLLKCRKDELGLISESLIVNAQPGIFGVEVLVNDRKVCAKLYPKMVIEPAALEDIMLFYVDKNIASATSKVSEVSL